MPATNWRGELRARLADIRAGVEASKMKLDENFDRLEEDEKKRADARQAIVKGISKDLLTYLEEEDKKRIAELKNDTFDRTRLLGKVTHCLEY